MGNGLLFFRFCFFSHWSFAQKFIIQGCQENCRQDGRSRSCQRPYTVVGDSTDGELAIEHHPSLALSNGSARVLLDSGETHVLVSVKAELVTPALNYPHDGVIDVHVDRMQKRDEDLESTLTSLLLPHLVNTRKLCIVSHYYVWNLHLDILILASNGGSLLDICSHGIRAALSNTRLPNLSTVPTSGEGKPSLQVNSDIRSACLIPGVETIPVIVTVSLLKCPSPIFILDATKEEEYCSFAQIHVVLEQSKEEPIICAIHKAGRGSLPLSLLQEVTAFVSQPRGGTMSVAPDNSYQIQILQESFAIRQQ